MMLPRAWAGLPGRHWDGADNRGGPASRSDTEALLYTIYAGPALEVARAPFG
jgi:hypothetical protein